MTAGQSNQGYANRRAKLDYSGGNASEAYARGTMPSVAPYADCPQGHQPTEAYDAKGRLMLGRCGGENGRDNRSPLRDCEGCEYLSRHASRSLVS